MLVNGLLSNIFAIGCLLDIDIFVGRTKRDPGAPGGKVPVSGTGTPGGSEQLLSHFIIELFVTTGFDM